MSRKTRPHLQPPLSISSLILAACCLLLSTPSMAGGSPETTLLVVNADSPLSLTVANSYTALREIPDNHIVWLSDIPSLGRIDVALFRDRIWGPIRRFMQDQGLSDQIDTIIYSADFPYAVDITGDLRHHKIKHHSHIGRVASLTGLTFFARQVENRRLDYLSRYPNQYFRRDLATRVRLVRDLPPDDERQLGQAGKALRKKEYSSAHETLLGLNAKHPDRAVILMPLAQSQAGLEQWDQAIASLKQLEALGFGSSLILRNDRHLKGLHDHAEFIELLERVDAPSSRFEPPHGFRSRYHWTRNSLVTPGDLDRYYLSAMLAFTGQRGSSLGEIERYLKRSAASDGGHPQGTVYLMENGDVRSETRQPWFSETCALLQGIGRRCEILSRGRDGEDGILPKGRNDIIGLTAGTRSFDWGRSQSSLLAGAIADSFTSYGGDFDNRKQTKLTEFLRRGAAGSSGAVTEPYAFPEKFPLPLMHYYYALGCSLAESWYQAVSSPYQAILVGDPLTRPFADFARLQLISPGVERPWQGTVQLAIGGSAANRRGVNRLELWLDGRLVERATPPATITWDTTSVDDGPHDLRLVAVESGPIETRSHIRHQIHIANHALEFELRAVNPNPAYRELIILTGKAPEGALIEISQGTRKLASLTVEKEAWQITVPTEPLGMGIASLHGTAVLKDGRRIRSSLVPINVRRSPDSPPLPEKGGDSPGMTATLSYQDGQIEHRQIALFDGRFKAWLDNRPALDEILIAGEFKVDRSGFHQLTISTQGAIRIVVDGQAYQRSAPEQGYGLVYVPMFLQQGWHQITLQPAPGGLARLSVLLAGDQAPRLLGGDHIRTVPPVR